MAQDDNDLLDATVPQVVYTTFDDGFVSEGEQRLERAHAGGAAGGEKNCCDLSHLEKFSHAAAQRKTLRRSAAA